MRVLFADDDVIARTLLTAVLADLDHEVTVVDDGEKAWAEFQHAPTPLVLLDINMPGMDGLEVCRRIRGHEAGREAFVLIITARDGRDDASAALRHGPRSGFRKLHGRLRRCCESGC